MGDRIGRIQECDGLIYLRLCTLALIFAPVALAGPQVYGPPADGSTPSSTSAAAVPSPSIPGQHIIQVFPGGNFVFQPANITAQINETVTFLYPANPIAHSVTQSSFDSPCNLLNENGGGPLGFDSGLQQDAQFSLVITNASQPIWFFCKQFGPPSHCGSGMVGAINAPATGPNTFDNYQAAAKKLGGAQAQDTHSGGLVGVGASATASAEPASTSGSSGSGGAGQIAVSGTSLLASLGIAFALL